VHATRLVDVIIHDESGSLPPLRLGLPVRLAQTLFRFCQAVPGIEVQFADPD
jgi:hypothetical protein